MRIVDTGNVKNHLILIGINIKKNICAEANIVYFYSTSVPNYN